MKTDLDLNNKTIQEDLTADNAIQPDLKASIDKGIERGLADIAAGNTMSAADCFDGIRIGLKEQFGINS